METPLRRSGPAHEPTRKRHGSRRPLSARWPGGQKHPSRHHDGSIERARPPYALRPRATRGWPSRPGNTMLSAGYGSRAGPTSAARRTEERKCPARPSTLARHAGSVSATGRSLSCMPGRTTCRRRNAGRPSRYRSARLPACREITPNPARHRHRTSRGEGTARTRRRAGSAHVVGHTPAPAAGTRPGSRTSQAAARARPPSGSGRATREVSRPVTVVPGCDQVMRGSRDGEMRSQR
jgi:hypothetical protein